jgi:hypothetical protein
MTRAQDRLLFHYEEAKRPGPWVKLVEAAGVPLAQPLEVAEPQTSIASEVADTLLPRPAMSGQHDSVVAVTSIALYHADPRRYFLERYLGFAADVVDKPAASGREFGSQVHALLAGVRIPDPDPEALQLVARFDASELGRRLARASRIEREYDFMLAIEDIVLAGQIDLWFEEGEELVLVDYKTDPDFSTIESYELQLRLYALALERSVRRPDRAILCFLRADRLIDVSLSDDLMDTARAAIRRFRQAQEGMDFPQQRNF